MCAVWWWLWCGLIFTPRNSAMSETVGVEGLPFCSASDHHHQQSASTELISSTIADDHMYSKWGSRSAETASHAASTSGYSSGTESLISNEENSVSLLSLTGSPTQSAKSLLMQSAKSLLTQSTTSLLTQSATSLVSQQARSLLKKNASAQVENVNTVDSPSTRRQSRKRTISKAKSTARNRKWCVLTVTVSVLRSRYGVGRALGSSLPVQVCLWQVCLSESVTLLWVRVSDTPQSFCNCWIYWALKLCWSVISGHFIWHFRPSLICNLVSQFDN